MKKMVLSDIKIKDSFVKSIPKEKKLDECRRIWNMYNRQDRYIVVNRNGELIDGYIQYLVLKENGVKEARVKISEKRRKCWDRINPDEIIPQYRKQYTTYIFGIIVGSKSKKERVWRVPNAWVGWEHDLLPGDKILVHSKNRIVPIVITQIKWTDECPVDIPVKRVHKKLS